METISGEVESQLDLFFFLLPACLEHPGMSSACLQTRDVALVKPEAIFSLLLGRERSTQESLFF